MPEKLNFSDVAIRALPFVEDGQRKVWDSGTTGLGLKIGATAKSWIVRYRPGGAREREITLGRWPDLRLAEARKRAREIRARAVDGGDALSLREQRRSELSVDSIFKAVIERYWAADARHKALRQKRNEENLIRNHVFPQWGSRPIADLTAADAIDLLETIAAKYPIQANRVLHALRRPFRWAVQRKLIIVSPVADLERLTPENQRERVLSDDEIKAIWLASGKMGVFGLLVRALLITGSRRDEVREATWQEFDVERGVWTRPASRMKGKVHHSLAITPMLEEILLALGGKAEGYVFSTDGGKTRYAALSRAKAKLDRLSGTSGWMLHDLRRTVRTRLAEVGVPFEVAERILAHRRDKIEQVYNRHEYLAEKRDAILRWEDRLTEIVGDRTARVVSIKKQGVA